MTILVEAMQLQAINTHTHVNATRKIQKHKQTKLYEFEKKTFLVVFEFIIKYIL